MPDWAELYLNSRRLRGVKADKWGSLDHYGSVCRTIRRFGLELDRAGLPEIREGLLKMQAKYAPDYFYHLVAIIKSILYELGRTKLAEGIEYPKKADRATRIKKKVLTAEERQALIQKAPTLSDRLYFELLDDSGGRRGELLGLAIKDVQFDQYGAILNLSGKTGSRRRRVYSATPDMREYVNNHPHRDDPSAQLLLTPVGRVPFTKGHFTHYIRDLSFRLIRKHVSPPLVPTYEGH